MKKIILKKNKKNNFEKKIKNYFEKNKKYTYKLYNG